MIQIRFECEPLKAITLCSAYALLIHDDLYGFNDALASMVFLRDELIDLSYGERLTEKQKQEFKTFFNYEPSKDPWAPKTAQGEQ